MGGKLAMEGKATSGLSCGDSNLKEPPGRNITKRGEKTQ